MKLLTCFVLMTITVTTARPLSSRDAVEKRQADVIKGALMPVMQSLQSLDTAIQGLTTDPQTAVPILSASDSASKTLSTAATQIQSADNLDLIGALGIQQTGTDLATQVNSTVTDLMAKKPVLDQLGVTKVAVDALQKQKTASVGLTTALLGKVPAIARPIAMQSTNQISDTLDQGIAALSAGSSTNGTATANGAAAVARRTA